MKKKEFLRQLSKKLDNMSKADREDVLAYYDELIEDKLDRTDEDEEDIIDSLGSIDRIARKVSKIANEENGKINVDEEEGYTKGNRKRKRKANGLMAFISTIIAIILIPAFLVLGIIVGAVIISIFVSSIAIVIAGLYIGGSGVVVLFSSLTLGLFQIGVGIAAIGLGIILAPSITKFICFLFKSLIKASKAICRGIKYIGGRSYEN